MELIIIVVLLGYIINFLIFLKNLFEINYLIKDQRKRLYGINFLKVLGIVFTKGYIPFWTLLKYKPFTDGYFEYKKNFVNADSIDYLYYLTLEVYRKS